VDETSDGRHRHETIDFGPGSHAPLADRQQAPDGFPIKGKITSRRYHVPGSRFYDRTVAEIWFASSEAAEAAGFQLPQAQRAVAAAVAATVAVAHDEPAAESEVAPMTSDREPEVEPPANPSGYVSNFGPEPGASVPAPSAAMARRVLPAAGAGVIAFLVVTSAMRRRRKR
jgi:hypothetical protein